MIANRIPILWQKQETRRMALYLLHLSVHKAVAEGKQAREESGINPWIADGMNGKGSTHWSKQETVLREQLALRVPARVFLPFRNQPGRTL